MGWVIHFWLVGADLNQVPDKNRDPPRTGGNSWSLKVEQHSSIYRIRMPFVRLPGCFVNIKCWENFTQKSPNTCLVHWYPGIRIHPRCIYNSHLVEPFIWVNLQFHQPPKYVFHGCILEPPHQGCQWLGLLWCNILFSGRKAGGVLRHPQKINKQLVGGLNEFKHIVKLDHIPR